MDSATMHARIRLYSGIFLLRWQGNWQSATERIPT